MQGYNFCAVYFLSTPAWNIPRTTLWRLLLCSTDSLEMVATDLVKCKLDLVGVQKVIWEKGDTGRHRIVHFCLEKEIKIIR
jgi:hypothetical protein